MDSNTPSQSLALLPQGYDPKLKLYAPQAPCQGLELLKECFAEVLKAGGFVYFAPPPVMTFAKAPEDRRWMLAEKSYN